MTISENVFYWTYDSPNTLSSLAQIKHTTMTTRGALLKNRPFLNRTFLSNSRNGTNSQFMIISVKHWCKKFKLKNFKLSMMFLHGSHRIFKGLIQN